NEGSGGVYGTFPRNGSPFTGEPPRPRSVEPSGTTFKGRAEQEKERPRSPRRLDRPGGAKPQVEGAPPQRRPDTSSVVGTRTSTSIASHRATKECVNERSADSLYAAAPAAASFGVDRSSPSRPHHQAPPPAAPAMTRKSATRLQRWKRRVQGRACVRTETMICQGASSSSRHAVDDAHSSCRM